MDDKPDYIDRVSAGIQADLADIIYRIEPHKVPLLAYTRRPLTKKESKKLRRLERGKNWKKLRRYRAKLDRLRGPRSAAEIGANQVLTEWLVEELNADDNAQPEGGPPLPQGGAGAS